MVPVVDGREVVAVFCGGVAGALARAGVGEALPHGGPAWPWATLAVNVAGAFVLGLVVARAARWRMLMGTGFCGALTTFSALQLELVRMLDDGRIGLAVAYAAASLALGLAAVSLGLAAPARRPA